MELINHIDEYMQRPIGTYEYFACLRGTECPVYTHVKKTLHIVSSTKKSPIVAKEKFKYIDKCGTDGSTYSWVRRQLLNPLIL